MAKDTVSLNDIVDYAIDKFYESARCHGDPSRIHLAEGIVCNDTFFNTRCGIIKVGKGTHFGHGAKILTGMHDYTDPDFPLVDNGRDIIIGEHCWICSSAIIIGPCVIGDWCIIGAGAVVTKDCESRWMYAGNPAKKIKPVQPKCHPPVI